MGAVRSPTDPCNTVSNFEKALFNIPAKGYELPAAVMAPSILIHGNGASPLSIIKNIFLRLPEAVEDTRGISGAMMASAAGGDKLKSGSRRR